MARKTTGQYPDMTVKKRCFKFVPKV